jgi:hypothetical protein
MTCTPIAQPWVDPPLTSIALTYQQPRTPASACAAVGPDSYGRNFRDRTSPRRCRRNRTAAHTVFAP